MKGKSRETFSIALAMNVVLSLLNVTPSDLERDTSKNTILKS